MVTTTESPIEGIRRGLETLIQPGDVFEVRCLNVKPTHGRGKPFTSAGYFDDFDKAAMAIAEIDRDGKPSGVYITMNPPDPALLARAANRLEHHAGTTTSDANITARRWLLVDLDCDRPAKISASDDEKRAARLVTMRLAAHLRDDAGWPDPVEADSGNGFHLLYRIDLPNDDDAKRLVEGTLKGLAAIVAGWSDDGPTVKVDMAVGNAARITKAYGTMARKGDDIEARPHRRSGIINAPADPEIVTVAALQAISPPNEPKPAMARPASNGGRLDVARWLTDRGVGHQAVDDGTKYVLDECPFNPDHKAPDAAIFQYANGATGFHCFHDSCAGKRWADARDAIGKPDAVHYGFADHGVNIDFDALKVNGKPFGKARGIEPRVDIDECLDDAASGISSSNSFLSYPSPPDDAAYHGVVGDLVRLVEPHTEADPAAILIQTLVTAGSVIGRRPYYLVGDTAHHLNLYAVIVGESSRARKGTSGDLVLGAFRRIDDEAVQDWLKNRRLSGLSSGEGLIYAVRDPLHKMEPIKGKGGKVEGYQEVLVDPGESDKRLLVMESEYGNVLRVIGRERNTLSAILRQGWDSGDLRTMTKNSPTRATGAHVSIIGHITVGELRHLLSTIDASNGYSNRHLWACAKRTRLLPDPTMPTEAEYRPVAQRLAAAIDAGRGIERITRGEEAGEIWRSVYPHLSRDRCGLAGDCTSRAEAQVTRLAALYAGLNGTEEIGAEHMLAALAVWDYCERSAAFIFGDKTGNTTADRIRDALRSAGPSGMARTDISEMFGKNKAAADIGEALALLEKLGYARSEKAQREGKGRPTERWVAT